MVVERGAAIAYQFAIDTKEASEMLDDVGNLKLVCGRLRLIFERFYRGRRQERSIIQTLCEQWGPTRETIAKVWPLIPKSHVKSFLKDYASNQTSSSFAENIEYQRCLIHGDLHLSNIMMGSVDVLIDFARSSDGPISVDAAKLISDFLLRLPSTRDDELPNWDSNDGVMGEILSTIRDPFNFEQGDKQLFSFFLVLYLAVALQYNDIDKDTKAWIRGALSKVTM